MYVNPAIPLHYRARRAPYFFAPSGDDGWEGRSEGRPWKTLSRLLDETALALRPRIYLEAGASFSQPLVLNADHASIDVWGGSARATINCLRDITGTTGDWSEVGTDGITPSSGSGRWMRTIDPLGGFMVFLAYDRQTDPVNSQYYLEKGWLDWKQSNAANVNAPLKWGYETITAGQTTQRIYFGSATNPALGPKIEINAPKPVVDATDRPVRIANLIGKGCRSGIECGGASAIWNSTMQFLCEKGIHATNGAELWIDNVDLADIGRTSSSSGAGDEGFHANAVGATYWVYARDLRIRRTKEDGITFGAGVSGKFILRCSSPGSSFIDWGGPGENPIDWKGGEFDGEGIDVQAAPRGFAPITTQYLATRLKLKDCLVNAPSITDNRVAVSIAEVQTFYEGERNGFAGIAGAIVQRSTGQASKDRLSIHCSDSSGTPTGDDWQGGTLDAVHCTIAMFGTATVGRAVWLHSLNRAASVVAIERVSGPDGDGNFIYRLNSGTAQNSFGLGELLLFGGLTGASTALNGQRVMTACYLNSGTFYAEFKVPSASSPPASVDKTGLTLRTLPKLARGDCNTWIGPSEVLRIERTESVPATAIGANYVANLGASEIPVRLQGTAKSYTKTQVTGTGTGSLWADTSHTMGGSAWRADNAASCAEPRDMKSIVGLAISSGRAIVEHTAHGWSDGRKVYIRGVTTPDSCNGWHRIAIIDANHYSYRALYGTADQTASGAIQAWDGTMISGAAGFGSAPTVDLDGVTQDFQGNAIPVSGRNFGAMP